MTTSTSNLLMHHQWLLRAFAGFTLAAFSLSACAQDTQTTYLTNLNISMGDQGWGIPGKNVSVAKNPLSIGGVKYDNGLGTHAPGEYYIQTNGAKRFRALVGVDDEVKALGTIQFSVLGDGKELWNSGILKGGDAAKQVDVDISKVKYLTLKTGDGGDNNYSDHGDWAQARFEGGTPVIVASLPEQKNMILSGKPWLDTDGNLIQAHGGGILAQNGTYYWYGENKSQGYNNKVGVSGYSSKDLVHWKSLGVVMPASGFPEQFRDQGVCERPKVIYNAKTKKYVMWAHMDARGYAVSEAGVCVADKPEGPFTFVRSFRPVQTSTFRDMNLFVDDDSKAYVFYSGEDNMTMHVIRLSDDYQNIDGPAEEGKNWARILVRLQREGPAPFKYNGKYYVITSACTGWAPNAAGYATADNILGPWTQHDNPFVGSGAETTFQSQSTYVIANPNGQKGQFIYMGDRWRPDDLSNSRYIWLPFQIEKDGTFQVHWVDGWKP